MTRWRIGLLLLAVGVTACGTPARDAASSVPAAASTAVTASAPDSRPATPGSAAPSSAVPTAPDSATGAVPGSTTADAPPSTPAASYGPSVTIPQPATALDKGLFVGASVGGGETIDMQVDTGSNGVVVSRRYLGSDAAPLSPAQPFTGFTYSSSGNTYNGEWMTTTLRFGASGSGDFLATTSPIKVRVVDEACIAGKCSTDQSTISVAMLGVGFDRLSDNQADAADGGQAINPFLNLEQMTAGTLPQAYVVTAGEVVLGPSGSDLTGFQTVALQRTTPAAGTAADWHAAPACVAVPSASIAPQCGTLLLDTGLGYAIVQVAAGIAPPTVAAATAGDRPSVAAGQQLQITVPGLSAPIYDVTVGGPGAPQQVQWGHDVTAGVAFMNISRFALSQTDYLYDASTGQVGFRTPA